MSKVFVSSKAAVGALHGVFAIDQTNAPLVQATTTNVSCLVGQFPWGQENTVVTSASPKDRLNMFAPFGMDHTGSGYLSIIRKQWPDLRISRVVGTTAAAAGQFMFNAGLTEAVGIGAKYNGAAGNSIIATVTDATDGDPLHFNLTVMVSGVGGSTQEIFQNLNYSGTGSNSTPDFTNTILTGSLTPSGPCRPANGSYALINGSDGTPSAADYIGTAGAGDKGFAVCEGDEQIRQIFTDDPGNTLRNAVNAGLLQHVESMGDRVAFISGNSGLTVTQTQTDVANYRSTRVVYMDPWVRITDDETGATQLVPPQSFGASVAAQLPPSTSIAWKAAEVGAMLAGIVSLEQERGTARGPNTEEGIATIFKHIKGGYRIESDPVTYAPINPAKKSLKRTRTGDFIAISFKSSVQDMVDAPNVRTTQQAILNSLTRLLTNLKLAKERDPAHNTFIDDFTMPFVGSTADEIAQGQLEIDSDVKIGPAIEQLFFGINYGEGVTVTVT